MSSLTGCVIVKGEAPLLEQSIFSIKELADEIVIVSKDNDNVSEIAKKFDAKVIDGNGKNDDEMRNLAIQNATKDWVIVIGQFEAVTEKGAKLIPDLLKAGNVDGYQSIMRQYTDDVNINGFRPYGRKDSEIKGFVDGMSVRLFRRKPSIKYSMGDGRVKLQLEGNVVSARFIIHNFESLQKTELFKKEKIKELEKNLKSIRELPNEADSYFDAALIYHNNLNDKSNAEFYYKKAIELNPKLEKAYLNLSALYIQGGFYDSALKFLEKGLKEFPNSIVLGNNLGQIFIHQEKFNKAVSLYRDLLKKEKENISLMLNLGFCYEQQKEYGDALRVYDNLLKINDSIEDVHVNRGIVLLGLKKTDEAEQSFMKAISINPHSKKALVFLSNLYLHKRELEKSMQVMKKLIEIEPHNKSLRDTYEKVSVALGKPETDYSFHVDM
jgi:tetratricopeptide (TPR) repeat protein